MLNKRFWVTTSLLTCLFLHTRCIVEYEPHVFYAYFRIVDSNGSTLTAQPGIYHSDSITVQLADQLSSLSDRAVKNTNELFYILFHTIDFSKKGYKVIPPLSSIGYLNYKNGMSDTILFDLREVRSGEFEGKVFLNGDSVASGNSNSPGVDIYFEIVK